MSSLQKFLQKKQTKKASVTESICNALLQLVLKAYGLLFNCCNNVLVEKPLHLFLFIEN